MASATFCVLLIFAEYIQMYMILYITNNNSAKLTTFHRQVQLAKFMKC